MDALWHAYYTYRTPVPKTSKRVHPVRACRVEQNGFLVDLLGIVVLQIPPPHRASPTQPPPPPLLQLLYTVITRSICFCCEKCSCLVQHSFNKACRSDAARFNLLAMASAPNLDDLLFGSGSQKASQISVLVPKLPLPADLESLVSHATTNERTSVMQGETVAVIVLVKPPSLPSVSQLWHHYFSHMTVAVRVLQPLEQKVSIGQKQATHKFLGAPLSLDSVNLAALSVLPLNSHGDVTSCYTSRLMGV
jgi:hypothetical protein